MLTNSLVTGTILGLLYMTSVHFNAYIDRMPASNRLSSGIVAWWVVRGVAYTSIAIFVLFGWWVSVSPWHPLATLVAVSLPCWIVAGVPMIIGEYRRMESRKQAEPHIERLKSKLGKENA